MGEPKEKDYYLQEAIRNAEELVVLTNDFRITAEIEPERYGAIESTMTEIRNRTTALLIAMDPDRDEEGLYETDIF